MKITKQKRNGTMNNHFPNSKVYCPIPRMHSKRYYNNWSRSLEEWKILLRILKECKKQEPPWRRPRRFLLLVWSPDHIRIIPILWSCMNNVEMSMKFTFNRLKPICHSTRYHPHDQCHSYGRRRRMHRPVSRIQHDKVWNYPHPWYCKNHKTFIKWRIIIIAIILTHKNIHAPYRSFRKSM